MTFKRMDRKSGFTLVEMAVVIALISGFAVFAMDLAQKKMEQNKVEVTRKRMEYIQLSIENYVRRYGRLPCPADPTQAFTSATFGKERTSGISCDSTTSNLETTSPNGVGALFNDPDVYAGALPVYTLQLPLRYVMDGWGNRFTYAVSIDLTNAATYGSPTEAPPGEIMIFSYNSGTSGNWSPLCSKAGYLDADGLPGCSYSWNFDATNTAAAFALVSHGPNGYGAWPGGGGTRATSSLETAQETTNRNGGSSYAYSEAAAVYFQAPPSGTFDDLVIYSRKFALPTPCTTNCP